MRSTNHKFFWVMALVALVSALGCGPERPASSAASELEGPTFPIQNRPDVRGTTGAVSAGHPLAAAVGYDVLRRGGNATDAVIAMAGVLAVVRPHMNGVGGDAFGLFLDGATRQVTALNGSGAAGARATPDFFRAAGDTAGVSETGPRSVSVPGAVAAWADALDRYGTWSLGEVLRPAVGYARNGFPVSWRLRADFEAQGGALNEPGRALYLPGGAPPPEGALLTNPALAETLERISSGGAAGFYQGPVGEQIVNFLEAEGGTLTLEDLAGHRSEWVEPLSLEAMDHRFLVLPPNTQGIAQLQLLAMADAHGLDSLEHNSAEYLHGLIELKKVAFADRDRWAADMRMADIPVTALLDPAYLAERAGSIDARRAAAEVAPGIGEVTQEDPSTRDDAGDTVYLTAVDRWGNAVSWIQSLFHGFGSGLLEPETGVMLHNRGSLFTLQEGHPNLVAPGKRPYHTLSPMLAVSQEGDFAFTLGTPGGDSQPQSLTQIIYNLLVFGMSPQEAIEAPRFRSYGGLELAVEDRFSPAVRDELAARGHDVRIVEGWTATFGGAQMIQIDPDYGTLVVGSDPRREAYGIAY